MERANSDQANSPSRLVVWPSSDSPVSLVTWAREVAALARDQASPPPLPDVQWRGKGRPVLSVPGFFSPDLATARLREFLNAIDFRAYSWELGVNVGPTRTILQGLEQRLAEIAERHGEAPVLIGQSLGGMLARYMAARRPDLVSHLVTMVSPIHLPVPTPLAPFAKAASLVWDDETYQVLDKIADAPPMKLTAIVSRRDGLVDWRSCVPAPAPNVEVLFIDGAHTTIGSNPEVQRALAERLSR